MHVLIPFLGAFQEALPIASPLGDVIAQTGGWGLSGVLLGVVAYLYRQLAAQYKAQIDQHIKTTRDLTEVLRNLKNDA